MPFAGYKDFADCVKKNKDKEDPEAYCSSIMREVEGKKSFSDGITFKSFVSKPKIWKESKDGVERTFMKVPLSGTGVDRDGERMSIKALESMTVQLKTGKLPFYGNHGTDDAGFRSYKWQDMMGSWVDAEVVDKASESVLYGVIMKNDANEMADKFFKYAESGMPLGFSIGGKVQKEFDEVVEDA